MNPSPQAAWAPLVTGFFLLAASAVADIVTYGLGQLRAVCLLRPRHTDAVSLRAHGARCGPRKEPGCPRRQDHGGPSSPFRYFARQKQTFNENLF